MWSPEKSKSQREKKELSQSASGSQRKHVCAWISCLTSTEIERWPKKEKKEMVMQRRINWKRRNESRTTAIHMRGMAKCFDVFLYLAGVVSSSFNFYQVEHIYRVLPKPKNGKQTILIMRAVSSTKKTCKKVCNSIETGTCELSALVLRINCCQCFFSLFPFLWFFLSSSSSSLNPPVLACRSMYA